jgi:DNA sulfur modification protein DndC
MPYTGKFQVFEEIIQEMMVVYQHDRRPWLIGYSGGKDSTLLVALAYEAISRLPKEARTKKVYIITSDTLVENPIVKRYMHTSSNQINESSKRDRLNIDAHVIYPEPEQTFWSRVIGLGYPTPEPPGFRWCTERLKIAPMNRFVDDRIKESGEIIILLGVRKAESATRNRTITAREIEGKLLNMHSDIKNAYVYNPITEIHNELVWEFLLKEDGISPWGSDLKYLFSLYQGEDLGEEQSVIGEVDKDKIPVTGNSRFGCWCCTIVKEDKSLLNFIKKGSTELIPLRDFRNWLVSIRQNPEYRDTKRRDGSVYYKADGTFGFGPFTMWGRQQILRRLLELQRDTQMELITMEELKVIDQMWDNEGDLSKRLLVDTYYEVYGHRLPWDPYKEPLFDKEGISEIKSIAQEYDLPEELVTKLIVTVEKNKHITRNSRLQKEFDKVMQQEWIHFDAIRDGMNNENN